MRNKKRSEIPTFLFPSTSRRPRLNYSVDRVDSCFEKGCRKKCARQSRKVMWDMINTLFVTIEAVEPTFVAFL